VHPNGSDELLIGFTHDGEGHTFPFVKCFLVGVYPFFSHAIFVGMGDVGRGGSDFTLASQVFDGRCILKREGSQDQSVGSKSKDLSHSDYPFKYKE
jgi:hypothetical protein